MDLGRSVFPADAGREARERAIWLRVLLAGLLLFFLLRAGWLQIVQGGYYRALSENNRVRIVPIYPQRGLIYDRRGTLLANNVPSFNLYLVPEDIPDLDATLNRVAGLIAVDAAVLKKWLNSRRPYTPPFLPIKLQEDLDMGQVAAIEMARLDLPGVMIQTEVRRNYLFGAAASHVLGYVGEASPAQLEEPSTQGIPPGSLLGQNGLEKTYDRILRGKAGQKGVEVDALGHERRVLRTRPPQKGDDLFLTLDWEVQLTAEEALGKEAGAIVALDPRSGDVLAMASHPAFDPNLLSSGVSPAEWDRLVSDPLKPLSNRAIQGQYPPGSVFKLALSTAGLESGQPHPATRRVYCPGQLPFGNRVFRDWKEEGHGWMDLHQAIVQSCDVFFYDLGNRLGVDLIARYAGMYGLGRPTGIELPSEKAGLIPSTEWKRRARAEPWYPGETLSLAIGQGYVTVTPLQLVSWFGSIGVSGDRYRPRLLAGVRKQATKRVYDFSPVSLGRVDVSEETFASLRQALRGVVAEVQGTGGAARSSLVAIAGKTGTAQVVALKGPRKAVQPKDLRDHAWFVAFAPLDQPRIAVAVLVEHGGHGGASAAPLARRVIEAYLKEQPAEKPLVARREN